MPQPPTSSAQHRARPGLLFTAGMVLGLSLVAPLSASETPDIPNYLTRVRQVEDGLPENNVTAVVQTRDGYLWLGTRSGLARFDGDRFAVFDGSNTPEMQSRHVTSLFEAADGTLWIGYDTGEVTCYKAGRFQAVTIHGAWRGGKIFAIGGDAAGDIWLLNDAADLLRVRDGLLIAPASNAVVHLISMARKPEGGFWIQRDNELLELVNDTLRLLPLNDITNRYIQGISVSSDGGLWVMTESRIQKWKDEKWAEDLGPAPWELSPVHTLIETRDGHLAAATVNHGLFLIFPGKGSLQFCRSNGFSSDWVTSVCEDREGNLWAGTANGGLAVLRAVNVTTLTPPDLWQGRAVLSVSAGDDGALWIGTEGAGLYRFDDGEWETFDEASGLFHRYIWSVTQDSQGKVWAGSWGSGVFALNDDRFERPPELEDMAVAVLHSLPDGELLVGTSKGLLSYAGEKTAWLGRKPELVSPDVRTIVKAADGTIWFGMSGGGLGRLKDGKLRQFRRADGLSSDFVQCLHLEKDGTLWIGTFGGGLNRFKDGRFTAITKKEGLPNDVICEIQDDGLGFFWISSHGGITRVSKTELDRCADDRFVNERTEKLQCLTYGLSDGLPSLESSGGSKPAGCRTADGRLWFATVKGLVGLDPSNVRTNQLPPPVIIEEVRVDGHVATTNADLPTALQIAPGRHRLEFGYTGLSLVAPERVRFKYRLDGLEQEWVDAGDKRVANYSFIPPGQYTFHVIACNNDGIWNTVGAQIAFTVLPYFWQTWWFRIMGGVFTAVAGGGIVWLDARRRTRRKLERLERQRAVEHERARIAHDIHDDLGSHLTRITMLSESARGEMESSPRATADISQIYDTARELTRAMDEIVWAVNPKHDTMDSLASYLEKFAFDFLRTAGIRCRLDLPLRFPGWLLTAEVRHNLFLAYKEALNNVVKHAAAKEVRIQLSLNTAAFELTIEDDGCGFTPREEQNNLPGAAVRLSGGNGLDSMVRRLSDIGGRCSIQSNPGKGTKIVFVVPVKTPTS